MRPLPTPYCLLPIACGHRLPRKLVVPRGGVIREAGHDYRRLLQIVCLGAVENVLVRVMRAGVVFDSVLDELEARQPDAVEGLMVRAAGIRDRHGRRAHLLEWRQPVREE